MTSQKKTFSTTVSGRESTTPFNPTKVAHLEVKEVKSDSSKTVSMTTVSVVRETPSQHLNLKQALIELRSGKLSEADFDEKVVNPLTEKWRVDSSLKMGELSGFSKGIYLLKFAKDKSIKIPLDIKLAMWDMIASSRDLDIFFKSTGVDGFVLFTQGPVDKEGNSVSLVYGNPVSRIKEEKGGVDIKMCNAKITDVVTNFLFNVDGCFNHIYGRLSKIPIDKLDASKTVSTSSDRGRLTLDYNRSILNGWKTLMVQDKPFWQTPIFNVFKTGLVAYSQAKAKEQTVQVVSAEASK